MTIALIIAGWLACSVVAYLLFRADNRRTWSSWSAGDRAFGIGWALLGGPISMGVMIIVSLPATPKLRGIDWDRPAKW